MKLTEMQKEIVILVLSYLLHISITVSIVKSTKFGKVSSILPTIGEAKCLIETVNIDFNSQFYCPLACSNVPNCSLACTDQKTVCKLYNASVSTYWNPDLYRGPKTDFSNFTCYTSYISYSDITGRVVDIKGLSWSSAYWEWHAIDGYSCMGAARQYGTGFNNGSYYEVKFGSINRISRITIRASYAPPKLTYLRNLEIRVGNESGISGAPGTYKANFSSQSFFNYYVGMADQGELVTFAPPNPIYGMFVSFNKINDDNEIVTEELKMYNN